MKKGLIGVVALVCGAILAPSAFAHSSGFTVASTCNTQTGQYELTWTLTPDLQNLNPEVYESNRASIPVGSSLKTSPQGGATQFTESLPGTTTGPVSATVRVKWTSDGYIYPNPGNPASVATTNLAGTCGGTIQLKKEFIGGPSSQRADLFIKKNGTTIAGGFKDDAASGEGTAVLPVAAGSFAISELDGANTDLSDYTSTFDCTENGVAFVPSTPGTSGSVTVAAGKNVVCWFHNTLNTPGNPDVSIAKTTSTPSVAPGAPVSYTLTVTNSGTADATDATITDTLPAGVQWTVNPQKQGCAVTGGVNLACTGLDVPKGGGTTSVTVTGTAPSGGSICSLTNVSAMTSATGDSNSENNTQVGSSVIGITCSTTPPPTTPPYIPHADITVTKAATPAVQLPLGGGTAAITYAIVVTNGGPDPAVDVKVADAAPASVTFVSASTSAGTCTTTALALDCTISSLAVGASVSITVNATVNATGTKVNLVTVTTTTPETNDKNNSAQAQTVVTAPVTPPTTPKPPKSPVVASVVCSTVVTSQKTLHGNGKKQTFTVRVTRGASKVGVTGARVRITGPGITKTVRTGKNGRVKVTVTPTKPGIIRLSIVGAKACNTQRIGVIGTYEPPVTG